jgi:hypothetical protein
MKHINTFEGFLNESSNSNGVWIYLDDLRTPIDKKWIIVRTYSDFVKAVKKHGLDNISKISFDHDLNDFAGGSEKTGKSAADWLVGYHMDLCDEKVISGEEFPEITVHSDNPVGAKNIISYINNYLKALGKETGKKYTQAIEGKPKFVVEK